MSTFTTKKSRVSGIGATEGEVLKNRLLCAPDRDIDLTHTEIDGVRRVTKMVFTSALLDIDTSSTVVLTRDFIFQVVDPYDLTSIEDTLVVT